MGARLQQIIDEIQKTRSLLLTKVSGLTQSEIDFRPVPDQWSIGEILHHLSIIENQVTHVAAKQIQRAEKMGLAPDPSDESVLHSLDQFAIETAPQKITSPQFAVPTKGMKKEDLLEELKRSRIALMEKLSTAHAIDLSRLQFPHPVLGRLDMYQWILYIGKHEQRHINQIELLRSAMAPDHLPDAATEAMNMVSDRVGTSRDEFVADASRTALKKESW